MKLRANIELEKIKPHPLNPRQDLGDLTELAASIKANGVLQNVTVIPETDEHGNDTGCYITLIGHRRCAAAKEAGLTEVPCVVNDEFDERDQVAMMVIENDQRAALTPYEQAKGYQVMLDLGMSVRDISEKVGASERKVRRRIKLTELDEEALKAASLKAISFDELEKLNAIKDDNTRNDVLSAFGTSEYSWKYRAAIEKERQEEQKAIFRSALMKKGAIEGRYEGTYTHNYIDSVPLENEAPSDLTEKMLEGIQYFFSFVNSWCYLYTEKTVLLVPQDNEESEQERADKEREERIEKSMRELDELCKMAYKLRTGFIASCSEQTCKAHVNDIISFLTKVMWSNGAYTGSYWVRNMYPYVGGESADAKTAAREFSEFYARTWPHQTLLWNACAMLNDSEDEDFYNGACEYERNEKIMALYELLEKLGYEMSSVEKALIYGTHELFEKGEE